MAVRPARREAMVAESMFGGRVKGEACTGAEGEDAAGGGTFEAKGGRTGGGARCGRGAGAGAGAREGAGAGAGGFEDEDEDDDLDRIKTASR